MARDRKGDAPGSHPMSRTVFVGNLPYEATEADIDAHFRPIGPVKAVRLAFDKETGKPRGFGFVEYFDTETALAAQRHLNNTQLRGRALKVDFAPNHEDAAARGRGGHKDTSWERAAREGPPIGLVPPDYPLAPRPPDPASADGAARAADAVAEIARGPVTDRNGRPDHVTEVLATLTEAQLWEVLTQMKGIVRDGPDQARQLLISHPQLTRALLQALVMLGVTRSPSEPRSAPADQPWPAHAPAPEPQLRDTRGPPADPYARPPGYGAEPAARDDPYAYTAPRQDPYARDPEPRGGYYARDAYPAEGAYPRDGGYGRDDPYARGYGRDAPPGPAPHDMGRAPPAADMGAPLPAGDPRGASAQYAYQDYGNPVGQYAQPSHAQVGAPRPDMAAYPPASRPMEYPPVPRAHEYPPAGATAPGMPAGVAPMAVPAAAPAPAGGGGFEVPAQDTVTEAVRQRVMAMSEAEIANLEPALREKVLLIRAMHGQAGAA